MLRRPASLPLEEEESSDPNQLRLAVLAEDEAVAEEEELEQELRLRQ